MRYYPLSEVDLLKNKNLAIVIKYITYLLRLTFLEYLMLKTLHTTILKIIYIKKKKVQFSMLNLFLFIDIEIFFF